MPPSNKIFSFSWALPVREWKCIRRTVFILLLGIRIPASMAVSQSGTGDQADSFSFSIVQDFARDYCLHCHGPDKQKGDFRIDLLTDDFSSPSNAGKWVEVMDNLNGGDMPPEDEPQPDAGRLIPVIEWIERRLASDLNSGAASRPHSMLRRLNRSEYNNTVRDLVGIDFSPADAFPEDPPAHGFDNVGSALSVSPIHAEMYLDAAREVISRAFGPEKRPQTFGWHMEVETAHVTNRFEGRRSAGSDEYWVNDPHQSHRYIMKGGGNRVEGDFLVQRHERDGQSGFRWFRFPAPGIYRISVRAAAAIPDRSRVVAAAISIQLNKQLENWEKKGHSPEQIAELRAQWIGDKAPEIRRHFNSEPWYDYGPPRMKVATAEGDIIGEVDVTADPESPHVHHFECEIDPDRHAGINVINNYHIPGVLENFWFQNREEFPRPELFVDWVKIEGPLVSEWPPESRRRVLSPAGDGPGEKRASRILESFMRRAWRRPVQSREVDAMVKLYSRSRKDGASFEDSLRLPLAAILCSPHFLYLHPPGEDQAGMTRPFALASRLSYFLWSSMPDESLFKLAESGEILETGVLQRQVDRMLADPRSEALITNFAGQWLGLRKIGANPPVETLFPRYDRHLEISSVEESLSFFRTILREDRPVSDFLASDYVTINERLARFYGIQGVRGDAFRKVDVPPGIIRGGLLTQASILTLTSNGTRTSPVIRGTWILENILGNPPPPPPPDAGDIQPSVPGIDKATVRVRLEAHRKIEQCARCHRKIDPLGFALENFHADGAWRDREGFGYQGRIGRNDPIIDASGQLPDGRAFKGVRELQQILLQDIQHFEKCLTEKLAVYALGRALTYEDRPWIKSMVRNMPSHGHSIRGLIRDIVTSPQFLP